MKGAGKIILIVTMFTSSLLLYVHLHVSLFRTSYAINEKSQDLTQKSEMYRHLKYNVDKLKAPRRLEQKMEELSLDLAIPKQIEVVKVPEGIQLSAASHNRSVPDTFVTRFGNYVGQWIGVAQAKTDSKS